MAEIADVEADGRTARTIAVESEDPAAVIAAVRGLGLDSRSTPAIRGASPRSSTPGRAATR